VTSVTWHPNPEFLRESLQAAILVADAGARNNRVTGRSCGYGVKVSRFETCVPVPARRGARSPGRVCGPALVGDSRGSCDARTTDPVSQAASPNRTRRASFVAFTGSHALSCDLLIHRSTARTHRPSPA